MNGIMFRNAVIRWFAVKKDMLIISITIMACFSYIDDSRYHNKDYDIFILVTVTFKIMDQNFLLNC